MCIHVCQNIDQPVEFWQSDSDSTVHSQLLFAAMSGEQSPLSRGPSALSVTRDPSSVELKAPLVSAGDWVEVDAQMSDDAVRYRLRRGEYNSEALPQRIELPAWADHEDEDGDDMSRERLMRMRMGHMMNAHSLRDVPWSIRCNGSDIECTLLSNSARMHTTTTELRLCALDDHEVYAEPGAALSAAAKARLEETAASAVVISAEATRRIRSTEDGWQLVRQALQSSVLAIFLEQDEVGRPPWFDRALWQSCCDSEKEAAEAPSLLVCRHRTFFYCHCHSLLTMLLAGLLGLCSLTSLESSCRSRRPLTSSVSDLSDEMQLASPALRNWLIGA